MTVRRSILPGVLTERRPPILLARPNLASRMGIGASFDLDRRPGGAPALASDLPSTLR